MKYKKIFYIKRFSNKLIYKRDMYVQRKRYSKSFRNVLAKWKGRANNRLPFPFKYRNTKTSDEAKLTMEGGTRRFSFGGSRGGGVWNAPRVPRPRPPVIFELERNRTKDGKSSVPSVSRFPRYTPPSLGRWSTWTPSSMSPRVNRPARIEPVYNGDSVINRAGRVVERYIRDNPEIMRGITAAAVATINRYLGRPNTLANGRQVMRIIRSMIGGSGYINMS